MGSPEILKRYGRYQFIPFGILYLYLIAFLHWYFIAQANRNVMPNVVAAATNTPFFQAGPRFSDYYQILYAAKSAHPYLYDVTNYPQGALVVTRVFGMFPDSMSLALFLSISFGIIAGVVWFVPTMSKPTKIMLAINFPLLYVMDRGNLDLLAIALVLLSTSICESRPRVSGALLGLAIAMKLWPIVFLIAFFRHNKSRKVLVASGATAIGLTVFGQLLYGGWPFSALPGGVSNLGPQLFSHNVSLLSFFALTSSLLTGHGFANAPQFTGLTIVLVLRIAIGLFLLKSMWMQNRFSQRLLAAALFVILIPSLSPISIVAIMLAPLVAEMASEDVEGQPPHWWIIVSWILVLGPTAFWYTPTSTIGTDSLIVPIASLVLCTTLLQPNLKRDFGTPKIELERDAI